MDDTNTQVGGEQEAFESLAKDFGEKDINLDALLQQIKDSSVESSNTTENSQTQATETGQSETDGNKAPAENAQPSTVEDLQSKYDDLVAAMRKKEIDNANTMNLLYSRLNNLSDLYQQERQRTVTTGQDTQQKSDVPPAIKELQELYPEIYAGMQAYIDSKTKDLERVIDQKVAPVQGSVATMNQQSHTNAIMRAHPDVGSIIDSGKLDQWVNSLDPVAKIGANTILQYGDADAVNGLLSQYKGTKYYSASNNTSKSQTTSKPSGISNLSEDDLKRIIAAIGVTSNKGGTLAPQTGGLDENLTPEEWFNKFAKEDEKNPTLLR